MRQTDRQTDVGPLRRPGAENAGVENAGVEKAGVIKYGKPSEQKTVRY